MSGSQNLHLITAAIDPNEPLISATEPGVPGTIADAEYAADHETLFGLDSYAIVGLAFAAFVLVLWKVGAFGMIGKALDAETAKVKDALAEAEKLRAEAEALKAKAIAEAADIENQARATLAHAEDEARRIVEQAAIDAEESIERQKKLAEDRIAAEARSAEAELRGRAAEMAMKAATLLLQENSDQLDGLTDRSIAEISA